MRHITSLVLLIACTMSWIQGSTQGIVILDCIQDSFVLCAPDPGFSLPDNNQMIIGVGAPGATSCSGHARLALNITDDCGIIIRYIVDYIPFDGNDTIRLQDTSEVFLNSQDEATLIMDSKLFGTSAVNLNGLDYNSACPDDPGGFHRFLWTIIDECDDLVVCDFLLRMEDCVPPMIDAVGVSVIEMPPSMSVTIAAPDFVSSVVDDCSPVNWHLHSFSEFNFLPTKTFTCETIDQNGGPTFECTIYSGDAGVDRDCSGSIEWDERNMTQSTTIIVINQNGQCLPAEPFGKILSENQVPTPGVDVIFVNDSGDTAMIVETDTDGIYMPSPIDTLLNFQVSASRDDDDSVGVSTLDLVKIQKHLLGIESFDSPFKYIAADATNNERVSAADLLELRKLILRINHKHPNNESWRFVPASYAFPDSANPWPFEESFDLPGSENHDFVAVKIGDLSGSVTQPQLRSTTDPILFEIEDQNVTSGETVEIVFRSKNFHAMVGFQFTLQMKGIELLDIYPGNINIASDQFAAHENAITCSWFDINAVSVEKSDVLFTLVAKVGSNGALSALMDINSSRTFAESYIQVGNIEQIAGVQIDFIDELEANLNNEPSSSDDEGLSLFQNIPNPFKSETTIPFFISESGQVSLRVFNAIGREVYFSRRDFTAGTNAFRVFFSTSKQPGLMYYRVEKDGVVHTRKMISNN